MELPDELLEDEGVDVLSELVEEEPVADLKPPADCLNLVKICFGQNIPDFF